MEKKKAQASEEQVGVKFAVPAFRYEGKVYKSADVEAAVNAGDEEAAAIVANLVKIGSGVVEVYNVPQSQEGGPENE